MKQARVAVLLGSASDREQMAGAGQVLGELGVAFVEEVISAHRAPDRLARFIRRAERAGVAIFVAGAGWAAHLAGAVAARTTRPVIGVPLATSDLRGFDALLATVQMPPGVPVATVAVGAGGAKNAGWLAAQILALGDAALARRLAARKRRLARPARAR